MARGWGTSTCRYTAERSQDDDRCQGTDWSQATVTEPSISVQSVLAALTRERLYDLARVFGYRLRPSGDSRQALARLSCRGLGERHVARHRLRGSSLRASDRRVHPEAAGGEIPGILASTDRGALLRRIRWHRGASHAGGELIFAVSSPTVATPSARFWMAVTRGGESVRSGAWRVARGVGRTERRSRICPAFGGAPSAA